MRSAAISVGRLIWLGVWRRGGICYAPGKSVVYGTIHEKGETKPIGDSSSAVVTEPAMRWKKAWRAQPNRGRAARAIYGLSPKRPHLLRSCAVKA